MKTLIATGFYNKAKTKKFYSSFHNRIEQIKSENTKKAINYIENFIKKTEPKTLSSQIDTRMEAVKGYWNLFEEKAFDEFNNFKPGVLEIFEDFMEKNQ